MAPALVLFLHPHHRQPEYAADGHHGDPASWLLITKLRSASQEHRPRLPSARRSSTRSTLRPTSASCFSSPRSVDPATRRASACAARLRRASPGGGFVGINVYKMRYAGMLISGALGGHGRLGYTLTTANCGFERRRGGLRLPRAGRYDLRQLEAPEHRGASLLLRLFKCIAGLRTLSTSTATALPGEGIMARPSTTCCPISSR